MQNTDPQIRYRTYARKSSEEEDRQAVSIPSQIEELTRLKNQNGLNVADIVDESHSAKKSGQRPVFNQMICDIEASKITGILCWHANRLSRNAGDLGKLIDLMDQGKLREIRTPTYTYTNSNPQDKFLLMLFCGVAKLENDNKGVDVKRGLRSKREAGIFPAVAPPGYANAGTEKGNKRIANDPKCFKLTQQALRLVLKGLPPMEALRILNEEWGFRTIKRRKLGGGPLAESTWYEMLRNPFYCGWFISKGKWFKGIHEPMITEEDYWKLQEILGEKGHPRPQEKDDDNYLGMIRCGKCGLAVTRDDKLQVRCLCKHKYSAKYRDRCPKCNLPASKVSEKRKHEFHYLVCAGHKKAKQGQQKCTDPAMRRSEAEKQILARLEEFTIPQEFIDWAFETLNEQPDESVKTQGEVQRSLNESIEETKKQLSRLDDLYLKGIYEADREEEYELRRKQLIAKLEGFKNRLSECKGNDTLDQEEKCLYSFAKNVVGWFKEGEFRTRIQILNSLGGKGVLRDRNIELSLEAVFVELKNTLDGIRTQFPSFEPENFGEFCLVDGNQATVAAIKSTWLPGSDSNRQPTGYTLSTRFRIVWTISST